jgi:hypothetical protein
MYTYYTITGRYELQKELFANCPLATYIQNIHIQSIAASAALNIASVWPKRNIMNILNLIYLLAETNNDMSE